MRNAKWGLYTAIGLIAAGFLLMFLSWNGAAEKDFVQGQLPYLLSGGLPGLGLVMTGLTLALLQGLRKDRVAFERKLEELLVARSELAPSAALSAVPQFADAGAGADLVVAGRSTYHDPGCRLVQGRPLDLVTPEEAEARRLLPCRICNPLQRTA